MGMHEVQQELGETGRFGEFFIVLGALIGLAGLASLLSNIFGFPLFPFTGEEDRTMMIQAMGLFVLEGVGFVLFGIMAIRAGWARHHPEADL